ncbi:MAG TPA: DMT family transporter [Acidimicrobiales bacterium]|nr:DMT family transporter [Acidimicrobiales bacterium]
MDRVKHPLALVGIGVLLFSTGPVAVAGSSTTGPVLSFWRLWIGSVLMGAATLVTVHRSGRRPTRIGWTWAARCGVAFGIHQLFFMIAIKATSVVDVTLMQVLQPVFVGVLAAVAFGERPGWRFRVWSAVAIGGAAVVVLAGASGPSGNPSGFVLAMSNVAFFAVYFVWSKQARDHIDTVPFLFGVVVSAGIVVASYVVVAGEPVLGIGRADLLRAMYIAAIPGALGHFVTTWPLPRISANVPPVMQLAMPFLAGALAWLLLDQRITALHVVGGAITIGGVLGSLLSPSGRRLVAPGPDATFVPGD